MVKDIVKETIEWKDSDFDQRLSEWGKWSEYFQADVEINPETGEGTIKLRKVE